MTRGSVVRGDSIRQTWAFWGTINHAEAAGTVLPQKPESYMYYMYAQSYMYAQGSLSVES